MSYQDIMEEARDQTEMERIYKERDRLLAALNELVTRCDGAEGVRADGSNIQTIAAHALLRELGEE